MSNTSLLVLFLGVVVLATPSTSRKLYNNPEFDREAIEQLYVQAQAIVDTFNEETANHHLPPLPSKRWEDKAAEIREQVKDYLDEALSPSGTLDIDGEVKSYLDESLSASEIKNIDDEVKKYLESSLSPSERQDIENEVTKYLENALSPSESALSPSDKAIEIEDEKENHGHDIESQGLVSDTGLTQNILDLALSPSGVDEVKKVVENNQDSSLTAVKTWNVDDEAENYHHYALSPADRLEERAVEMELEADSTSTSP